MKKHINLITIILFFFTVISSSAQGKKDKGETIFLKYAEEALEVVAKGAETRSITGVAIVAYIPGDVTKSWTSKMRVVGSMIKGTSNLIAIAHSKAAEMADTFQNSGGGIREPLKGEFGYQGGVIEKVEGGYVLAVFSGATGEQDLAVSNEGLTFLVGKFK
ncbi:MAG: hypothetical protein ACFHWX_17325 [Bacteroidota bacterium]